MRKHRLSVLALVLIGCIALRAIAQKTECSASGAQGDYSKLATSLCWQQWNELRHLNIWSPNHSVLILGRVFVENDRDLPTAYALAKQIQLMPPGR